jgi:hypothetical protein
MHGFGQADFEASAEPMGAVLLTCGGYVNALVDKVMARVRLEASRVVLCGHQHLACVALAAAMMRRPDPFALTVLLDPWPWEAYYLEHEQQLLTTRVVCVDNTWVTERERQRGATEPQYQVLRRYGVNAEGVTLAEGGDRPDDGMYGEVVHQLSALSQRR